ncbi:sensor histidine kinase [uncultured Sphingomonas sp.]|uniref:sensor histidine kinase n=1 Tax=uncultured Sphingomonas sp. TaxID=158754 RepID=UPI0035CBE640
MINIPQVERGLGAPLGALSRLPTGAKLFLILSAALLPLALIAIVATLQTSRLADSEARARLRVAATESARSITIELVGDMTALRSALGMLGRTGADPASCARVEGVFAQQVELGTRFVILDRAGRAVCGRSFQSAPISADGGSSIAGAIVPGRGLVLSVSDRNGLTARAFFSGAFLGRIGAPTSQPTSYSQSLMLGPDAIDLATIADAAPLDRMETIRLPLGLADLFLRTSIRAAPITSSFVVAMLLPILMWAAAAGIGWFVVDHLLIAPLRRLRTSVATYRPGQVIDAGASTLPAQEIRELGATFDAITRTVADHEAGLAEGLVRQTRLTREVHHRVKNNLQVISSLINFHARGAPTPEAVTAYASIQRRVDALAVVHRNHFAEMEDNRGLGMRSVLGELASNIRATAPDGASGLSITLDIDNYLVTQDVAVAVAFIVTEVIELAMSIDQASVIRIALKRSDTDDRARLHIFSRALVENGALRDLIDTRYGRVMAGLARQLRGQLLHDPELGAYEITVAVIGRD